MTRISFLEWLMAAILVLGLHVAALTGLIWLVPVSQEAAVPPPATEQKIADADTIDIAVTIIGAPPPADSVAIAEAVASRPAEAASQVSVPEAVTNEPQGNESQVIVSAPQQPTSLQDPELPREPEVPQQEQVAQQGAAVLQEAVPQQQQEQFAQQGAAVLQEAVPQAPQEQIPQQGPAVLQEQISDSSNVETQVSEAIPAPVGEAQPLPESQVNGASDANIGRPQVAAVPVTPEAPAASVPKPARATPAPASPLRDPVPIPKRKPVVKRAAPEPQPEPVEPALAAPTDQIEVAELSDPTAPQVSVLTPDQPATEAQEDYFSNIRRRIRSALIYPEEAIRDGKEGIIDLQIVIKRDGRIASYDILTSSGFKELDDAAVQTLIKVNPVAPFPDDVSTDELRISVPLRYLIDRS